MNGSILPSRGFAKLDSGITDSSLWMEDDKVLRVWVALLAKSDNLGMVRIAESNMAQLCRVTVPRLRAIMKTLSEPDEESRTPDNDGRRIKKMSGGWCILNYILYRDMAQRKGESHAARQQRYRQRLKERDQSLSDTVTRRITRDVEAEADTEAKDQELCSSSALAGEVDSPLEGEQSLPVSSKALSSIPEKLELTAETPEERKARIKAAKIERIRTITVDAIEAFNEILGKPNGLLPSVSLRAGFDTRVKQVGKCIKTASEISADLFQTPKLTRQFWRAYFGTIKRDPFKSGKQCGGNGHENWKPTFEYLVRVKTMLDVYDKAGD